MTFRAAARFALVLVVVFATFVPAPLAAAQGRPDLQRALAEASANEQVLKMAPSATGPALFEGAIRTDDGRIQVFIELDDPSAAVVFAEVMKGAKPSDQRARAAAASATMLQVAKIRAAQDIVAAAIAGRGIQVREIFRVQKALNGISVAVNPAQAHELSKIPGVKRVLPLYLEFPTNSSSVPFLGTPNVWANTIGLPAGADGTGIRIGVIDTGLDYMHADFGGTGVLADYQAESTDTTGFTTVGTAAAGSFPTPKTVGGTDFAGDAYTGSNAPVPDTNPMDCNGHGSHVAGTAAGFGVTAGDVTFTGPYDANPATYSALKIGPGTAPKAQLYGLRVFGCAGGTGLTTLAIDWAMDPNGDSDLSDHLDVINMSLGSNFGTVTNASSVASDNAALAGVIVVTSAGNAGDTFFISGAPGAATRVIATAASVDDGLGNGAWVQVNSPASVAGRYMGGAAVFGPAPSGQTGNLVIGVDPVEPAAPPLVVGTATDGCSPLTNAGAVAGNICVVDRNRCSFKTKVLNCQVAGAIGTIIVNNTFGSPVAGMAEDATIVTPITIPSVLISQFEGNPIKAAIPSTVNATLGDGNIADTVASFSSRGPRRIVGSPLQLKPDIAAPGFQITSVQTGKTCLVAAGCTGVSNPTGFQAGNQTLILNGTSMASPHVAGIMALLRQLKPDWSVEELKALAMNYAIKNPTQLPGGNTPRYGPSRIGNGRVDPASAAVGNVIAMNAEDAGIVTVAFHPEVQGVVTQTKKVRIVNKGTTSQTYDLGIDNVVDSPGVSFSIPGASSVTLAGGESVEIDVQMSADSATMDHTRDPSLLATQGIQANYGDQPRHFLAEEGAYLTFSQSATLKFRLALYMAEKAASNMSAPPTIVTGGAPTGTTTIPLSGSDLCTGTIAAGPTCVGSFPVDQESLVSPFELQVVSPLDPVNSTDYADIQYAGVAYLPGSPSNINNDLVMFGLSSWGSWSTPGDVAYNVCVDTNEDGVYDKSVINSVPSIFVANAPFVDTFARVVQDLTTGGFSILGLASPVGLIQPSVIDTALHLNSVMSLGTTPAQLGMTAGDTTFRYKVVTCPGNNPSCARTTGANNHCSPSVAVRFDEAAGPYFYNWAAQGLNFGGNFLDEDLNGNSLPVMWNTANMATNGSVGALLLHHHNKNGSRGEVVVLDTAVQTDLSVAGGATPGNPPVGSNVTVNVTVTNTGVAATGVQVFVPLPVGLTWVSDDSSGTYDVGTGLWTIAALPVGSQSLSIVATVDNTDPIPMLAQITAGTPVDTNPANNQSSFVISAPRSGDLVLTMAASGATAFVSDPISYTLTLRNNGIDPAYSIDVPDSFPAYPALAPATATPSQGVFDLPSKTWSLGSLPSGATATLVLGLNAPNIAGALQNTATATSTTADPNAINNTDSETIQILSPSNVTGTKTNTGQMFVGGTITYTVTLNNSATYDQQDNAGDEFVDVLPSTMTLVSASATSGSAAASVGTNTVTWNGVVPASGSVTITITATVNGTAAAGATITNTGTINYDANGDGANEANNSASANFVVLSPAVIDVATKTVAGSFYPGSVVTYTITLHNNGPSTQLDNATDELTDTVPAALTVTGATATSGTAAFTGNNVTWNGSIANGGTVTITITATLSLSATQGQVVSNQAVAHYDADGAGGTNEATLSTDDPGTGTAGDATSFTVVSPAIIDVATKTVAGSFYPGSVVTYTITLHNNGPSTQLDNATDELTDTVPAALTVTSATATSGTAAFTGNNVTWNGSIASGGTVTITITATLSLSATQGQTVSNQGVAHYDADGAGGTNEATLSTDDPGTGTSGDATSFTVVTPAGIGVPDKTVAGTFRVNTNVTYTVTVFNGGPSAQNDNATDEFTDVLPASLALVSANASTGTAVANVGTNTVTWNGSIANGGSVTITIVATILGSNAPLSTIANQGTFHADADGNGSNETNIQTNDPTTGTAGDPTAFTVLSPATIASATMTAAGPFTPGSNITYTVTLVNSGPDTQLDNPGDEFDNTLPASLTLVSSSASSGSTSARRGPGPSTHAGETVHWNGTIPAGGNVVITIVAQIDPSIATGTTISNQGTAHYDADGNGTNESDLETNDPGTGTGDDATVITVSSAATIDSPSKSVNTTSAVVGQTITYTVVITNSGMTPQGDNPGDEFVDILSSELDLLSATATSGTALANLGTNTVTWNGPIPASGSVTITINARVNETATGTVANFGTVNYDADNDGDNESQARTNDPSTTAPNDDTIFAVGVATAAIPALSPFAMLLMCIALALTAAVALRRML